MFIEACLLSLGLHSGSKFYKRINKEKIRKRAGGIKKVLGTEIRDTINKIIPSAKSPIKKNHQNEEHTDHLPARTNKFSNAQANRQLAVVSVSTALTGMGKLFFPPLIPLGLTGLVYPYSGILKRAYNGLVKERKVKMEVMGSILLPGMILTGYHFTSCFAIWIYYISTKLLNKIEDNTRQNLVGIFENQPRSVWIVRDGIEVEIPFDSLQTGHIATVSAGETIPADGVIAEGIASIDQHILTGESQPLEKGSGEPVFASTVVLAGRILIQVEKSGKDTVVANIADMLNRTVDFKTAIQSKGERVADQMVLPTLALSAVALPITGPVGALAVLNSYIAGDIRITAPLSTLSFLKAASQNGILIKDGRALELLVKADTVVFDKTGTLTLEQPHVHKIHSCNGYNETDILTFAAMAENRQTHPIARAILEKADEYDIRPDDIDDAKYEVGYGIKVRIANTLVRVGSARFMEMENIDISEKISSLMHHCHDSGHSIVMVAKDDHLAGAIELHATVRPEIRDIVSRLRKRGKSMYIITGDHEKPARMLAEDLGIENYFAETFPEQKARIVEDLQKQGKTVCFIGDGINDSVAMKKAHISVSLRGASTVATDTANIILMDGTLAHLDRLFELAEDFDKNINVALTTAVVPGIINIGSVFLFHTGIYFAIMLYYLSLPAGLANSFLPLLKYKEPKSEHIIPVK